MLPPCPTTLALMPSFTSSNKLSNRYTWTQWYINLINSHIVTLVVYLITPHRCVACVVMIKGHAQWYSWVNSKNNTTHINISYRFSSPFYSKVGQNYWMWLYSRLNLSLNCWFNGKWTLLRSLFLPVSSLKRQVLSTLSYEQLLLLSETHQSVAVSLNIEKGEFFFSCSGHGRARLLCSATIHRGVWEASQIHDLHQGRRDVRVALCEFS